MTLHQKLNVMQVNLLCDTELNVPHESIDMSAIKALAELPRPALSKIVVLNGFLTTRHSATQRAMEYDIAHSRWTDPPFQLMPMHLLLRDSRDPGQVHITLPYGTPCFAPLPDGRVLVCLGNEFMRDLRAYIFDPRPPAPAPLPPPAEDANDPHAPPPPPPQISAQTVARFVELSPEVETSYVCRMDASMVALHDGRVLRLGGWARGALFSKNAVYDPSSGRWSRFEESVDFPSAAVCIVLTTGDVLVCGGFGRVTDSEVLKTAYIYRTTSQKYERTGDMSDARAWHGGCLMQNGNVFVCGGTTRILPPKPGTPEEIIEEAVEAQDEQFIPAANGRPARRIPAVRAKPATKIPEIPAETYRGDHEALVVGADEYNVVTGKWTRMSLLSAFMALRPQCILLDSGSIFIMGDLMPKRETIIFDPVAHKLSKGPSTPIEYGGFIAIPVYT